MKKEFIKKIRYGRKFAVQALYQWLMTKQPIDEIALQFQAQQTIEKADFVYFSELIHGVIENLEAVDEAFLPYLDREIKTLDPVELTVLRIGAYELLFCLQVPYRVVLDESVSLAKTFGGQDGHRYVNGVLNHLAKRVRTLEGE